MPLAFGTDGVRGLANVELTPDTVLLLGRAAARVLGAGTPPFLVGRDTRRSGALLQAALSAGLASEGCDVIDLGVIPTPGIAYLAAAEGLPGAMISASHNPFPDNGIKLLSAGGRKLPDEAEHAIEEEWTRLAGAADFYDSTRRSGAAIGVLRQATPDEGVERYVAHLIASCPTRFDGVRLVLDTANGAAASTAALAFRALGATVDVIHDQPDGQNINLDCGSTHPQSLQAEVVRRAADLGLAFDGDADRVLAVDHNGALVDGDHIMAICARDMNARGLLAESTVVATVMSNLGFLLAMEEAGIRVEQTPVGDRYVLDALQAKGLSLGGEQSGHIIFTAEASTGDGVLTGIHLVDVVVRSGRTLADLSHSAMTQLPQVLRNVRVTLDGRDSLPDAAEVWAAVADAERALQGKGRVLLRPSGTEPLVRVMVEAATLEDAEHAAAALCAVVEQALGPGTEGVAR